MAAGDVTLDANTPTIIGNRWLLTGTVELTDVETACELAGTCCTLLSVQLVDEDGVGSASVELNQDADGTATNGTISAFCNSKTAQTFRFEAQYIM